MRALFFDLDHTLIRPLEGRTFPKDIDDWEFIPGVVEAIRPYMEAGFMFIIISNQGGIAAGFQTEQEVERKIVGILRQLREKLNDTAPNKRYAFRYSSTMDAADPYRKPNPGMVIHAAGAYDINLRSSIGVGDMNTDYEAFSSAGVGAYQHIDIFLQTKSAEVIEPRW